jgi:hypothetical protein
LNNISDCDDDNSAIYEEISTLTLSTPPPILRNDVLSFWEDISSTSTPLQIVPRPKVGWTNRKVTFVGEFFSIFPIFDEKMSTNVLSMINS